VVDGLKVLDPERPIREADKRGYGWNVREVPGAVIRSPRRRARAASWERSGARELVREAQRLRRRSLEGHQRSLRDVAAELARLGHVNAAGPRQQDAPVAADADDRGSVESHRAAARCP
jgi:hypothetical protein